MVEFGMVGHKFLERFKLLKQRLNVTLVFPPSKDLEWSKSYCNLRLMIWIGELVWILLV